MQNITIPAEAVLLISCSQGWLYIVEKGAKLHNDKPGGGKKIRVHLFFMYMYIPQIKFQDSSISGFLSFQAAKKCYGRIDGRTGLN